MFPDVRNGWKADGSFGSVAAGTGGKRHLAASLTANGIALLEDRDLGNAIDAMLGSDRRHLGIRTRRAGEFVTISVEDSGSGMDQAVAAKLFQPFITSKQGGMGVGLSISRTIVEAHGGKIWFEPVSSGGTVFHFTLPVARGLDLAK